MLTAVSLVGLLLHVSDPSGPYMREDKKSSFIFLMRTVVKLRPALGKQNVYKV